MKLELDDFLGYNFYWSLKLYFKRFWIDSLLVLEQNDSLHCSILC